MEFYHLRPKEAGGDGVGYECEAREEGALRANKGERRPKKANSGPSTGINTDIID